MLLFSPWIYVFYTDTLCLFPVSIVLLLLTNIYEYSQQLPSEKTFRYMIFCLKCSSVGIVIGIAYFIKPTSIIFVVALFLTLLLLEIKKDIQSAFFAFQLFFYF